MDEIKKYLSEIGKKGVEARKKKGILSSQARDAVNKRWQKYHITHPKTSK